MNVEVRHNTSNIRKWLCKDGWPSAYTVYEIQCMHMEVWSNNMHEVYPHLELNLLIILACLSCLVCNDFYRKDALRVDIL